MGKCCLCLEYRTLIDSHIIPNGFFDRILTDEPNLLIDEHSYPKKMRKGVYDQAILCADCDNLIGKWDDYAQKVLTHDMSGFMPIGPLEKLGGWERAEYDYPLLKLFFISLVWRASISSHDFYQAVSLGPDLEEKARLMLKSEDPGDPQTFGVFLARFVEYLGHAFINPLPETFDGLSYVRFYMAGFVIYLKIDSRPLENLLKTFLIYPGQPLRIIKKSIHDAGEDKIFDRLFALPKNQRKRR